MQITASSPAQTAALHARDRLLSARTLAASITEGAPVSRAPELARTAVSDVRRGIELLGATAGSGFGDQFVNRTNAAEAAQWLSSIASIGAFNERQQRSVAQIAVQLLDNVIAAVERDFRLP